MFKKVKILTMIVETPLHAGSGSDLGAVDLPIQRERHTDFPKVEGSSVKGCLREAFEEWNKDVVFNQKTVNATNRKEAIALTFGPEDGSEHAGALGFSDARLLLFPVKSMKGVFAWITCPRILQQFKNDLALIPIIPDKAVPHETGVIPEATVKMNQQVILEEYTFALKDSTALQDFAAWLAGKILPAGAEYNYWREKMKRDIVVLSDDDFRDFINLSTEVITRTKIDPKTGTVQTGMLFTEEYLPAESILYSLVLATPIMVNDLTKKELFKATLPEAEAANVLEFFTNSLPPIIQMGGNATIGKGVIRTHVM